MKVKENLRGMFNIVKGQYCKKKPLVTVNDNSYYIGAFDPENFETKEWYRVIDENGRVIHAGISLDKALNSIKREIIRSKTKEGYIKSIINYSVDNSKIMKEMDRLLIDEYGYYYEDMIEEMENEAYNYIKDYTVSKKVKSHFKNFGNHIKKKGNKVLDSDDYEDKRSNKPLVMHKVKAFV